MGVFSGSGGGYFVVFTRLDYILGNGVNRGVVFVEESKKEVGNWCFGRMYEGCAIPPLGKKTMARRVGRGERNGGGGSGEHKRKRIAIGKLRYYTTALATGLFWSFTTSPRDPFPLPTIHFNHFLVFRPTLFSPNSPDRLSSFSFYAYRLRLFSQIVQSK